jgi:preprotein translocase subunit SecE
MNRQTKRLMAKQEKVAEREKARQAALVRGQKKKVAKVRAGPEGEREGRIKRFRRFLREVRAELKKVAWPSRAEVLTYTVVVLVSVTTVTLFVFGLDFAFGKAVFQVFGS